MNLVDAIISPESQLVISPAEGSSKTDFDFLLGEWKIINRKLKTRLSGCTEWDTFDARQENRKILTGLGNTDIFYAEVNGQPFEGLTLRLFNPKTKLWSLYWADSIGGKMDPPLIGSFEKNTGTFYCMDTFNGQKILVMFQWDKTDRNRPVWSQAFSNDLGNNWEWNWYMYFEK